MLEKNKPPGGLNRGFTVLEICISMAGDKVCENDFGLTNCTSFDKLTTAGAEVSFSTSYS